MSDNSDDAFTDLLHKEIGEVMTRNISGMEEIVKIFDTVASTPQSLKKLKDALTSTFAEPPMEFKFGGEYLNPIQDRAYELYHQLMAMIQQVENKQGLN